MPDEDVAALKKMGVREVLLQDTPPRRDRRDDHATGRRARTALSAARLARHGRPMEARRWNSGRFRRATTTTTCPPRAAATGFRVRETMPAGDRERAILERLQQVCRYAWEHAPFYRRKWDEAGFHPEPPDVARGFRVAACRSSPRSDLRESQARRAAVRRLPVRRRTSEVFHIHGTSGTTGRPTAFAIGRDDWRRDRQRARAHHVGHGHAARRHRLHRRDLQPLHGQLGRAGRRRAAARQGVSVRRRRAGHDRARRAVARHR